MKLALVTGGSNGIGKATVMELARRGTGVIFTYHANKEGAEALARQVHESTSAKAAALPLDLSQPATFPAFTQSVRHTLATLWQSTRFHALVNNGGTGGGMAFAATTEDYFDKILNTNFKGPFFLTQHLLPLLHDGASIVNVSSNSTRIAPPGYSAYGSSKAALTCLTRYLAKELAPRHIRVNTISPGPVHTNFGDGAFDKHPEYIQPLAAQTALGRIGAPADLATVIANLLSDDFQWVTAQDIEVSGGFLL